MRFPIKSRWKARSSICPTGPARGASPFVNRCRRCLARRTTSSSSSASTSRARSEGAWAALACHALEDSFGNVEVRVHLLHVVVLLELVDQAQDLLRLVLVLDGDRRLGEHCQFGRLDLEAGSFDCLAHGGELLGGREHLVRGTVERDVVR